MRTRFATAEPVTRICHKADLAQHDPNIVGVGRCVLRRSWELGVVLAKKGMITNYDM